MNIKQSTGKIFTPELRQEVLDHLYLLLKNNSKIVGAILVGSGAYGFRDDFSDIDLAIVTIDDGDLVEIVNECKDKILEALDIIHAFEVKFIPKYILLGFLTEDFLELNISFQSTQNIFARRQHWKIAFDKTGTLEQIMEESWDKNKDKATISKLEYLVSGSWHYINSALIALSRENFWRVVAEIENLKRDLLEIISMRFNLKVNDFIDSDHMTTDFHKMLMDLLIVTLDKKSLFDLLFKITNYYFKEANLTSNQFGGVEYHYLEKRMNDYFLHVKERLFS